MVKEEVDINPSESNNEEGSTRPTVLPGSLSLPGPPPTLYPTAILTPKALKKYHDLYIKMPCRIPMDLQMASPRSILPRMKYSIK